MLAGTLLADNYVQSITSYTAKSMDTTKTGESMDFYEYALDLAELSADRAVCESGAVEKFRSDKPCMALIASMRPNLASFTICLAKLAVLERRPVRLRRIRLRADGKVQSPRPK